jgi:hypothetical protein
MPEDMGIKEASRPLISVAIHPSGYYLATACIDRIRVSHILHDELRNFRDIEIKNCQKMKFSTGGHYFMAADFKCIYVYNAYTLEKLHQIKITPKGIEEFIFGERDLSFAAVTLDGYIGRWRLPSF